MQKPKDILKKYWGYDAFRPLQEEIIQSVINKKDTLALLPTGGGKSICFQVPALCQEGLCIVISPLIALMKDQVEQLQKRGIKAAAVYSGMSRREVDITLDNCIYGAYKFLYVSPERLKTELFLERSKQMSIALLAIDEAHCISQWGYDFRPPYLEIASFKNELAIESIVALTATATKEVKQDIIDRLELQNPIVYQKSFARKNLSYAAFQLENKEQKLLEILHNVPGSSVIYVRNRKSTKVYAEFLRRNQISADYYHAGLNGKDRDRKQNLWINNQTRVIVATNAFGMGIDKPDVRTVVHMDLPDTLEAYYQEAGRAGRDEKRAYAVALFSDEDISNLSERVKKSSVPVEKIREVYQALCNHYQMALGSHPVAGLPFELNTFCKKYNLQPVATFIAIKKLDQEGILQVNEAFFEQSRVMILLEKEELYKYQVAHPKFDKLIKTLLRLYGGELMMQFVKIKEEDIGRLAGVSAGEVKKQLEYLHGQEVIDYQYPQDGSSISFLIPRVDALRLPINHQRLKERAQLAEKKMHSVIQYLKANTCRSLFLQSYFDEFSDEACGVCDNDLAKRKKLLKLSSGELLRHLKEEKSMAQLRSSLPQHQETTILEVLRVLIEDGKVEESRGIFRRVKEVSE